MENVRALIDKVAEIYRWIDSQTRDYEDLAGTCKVCGECCDFDSFGHQLFVTSPELLYLANNIGPAKIKPMSTGRCPYNVNDRCTIYKWRFAGCRAFCCNGDSDFQSTLSESALDRLKALCMEYRIPYRYMDLAVALNDLAAV